MDNDTTTLPTKKPRKPRDSSSPLGVGDTIDRILKRNRSRDERFNIAMAMAEAEFNAEEAAYIDGIMARCTDQPLARQLLEVVDNGR